jgi:hypothetical protein
VVLTWEPDGTLLNGSELTLPGQSAAVLEREAPT